MSNLLKNILKPRHSEVAAATEESRFKNAMPVRFLVGRRGDFLGKDRPHVFFHEPALKISASAVYQGVTSVAPGKRLP